MVSTRPLISKSSSPSINPLVDLPSAPVTIGITVTLIFHSFFSSLAKSRYLSLFLLSFSFTLWSSGMAKSIIWQFCFFFVNYHSVWSSGQDLGIHLYLKIPEKFVCLILHDRFWVVHIPFVHMVKFKLFAQFPVDHLPHQVMSSLILFFVLTYCFHLCDWLFHLYHHITYICYSVKSCLFLLWHN